MLHKDLQHIYRDISVLPVSSLMSYFFGTLAYNNGTLVYNVPKPKLKSFHMSHKNGGKT